MKRINLFLLSLIFLMASSAFAQKIKVQKVKGKKAVVDFVGAAPVVGETYDLGSGSSSSPSGFGASASREHLIGLSANLSSLGTNNSGSISIFSVQGRYGWNHGDKEYGGLGQFSSVSSGGVSTSTIYLGGFFDYNIVPNRNFIEMIYGAGGEAGLGTANTSTFGGSSSGDAKSTWYIYPSGFFKWFMLHTTTCFRADLGYAYQSIQSDPAVTVSGFALKVGMTHYF